MFRFSLVFFMVVVSTAIFLNFNNLEAQAKPIFLIGEDCSNPEVISFGQCITGSTDGYADDHDCGNGHGGPDRVYQMTLSQQRDVTFIAEGDFNADWTIATSCGHEGDVLCENTSGIHLDPSCGSVVHLSNGDVTWSGSLSAGT